MKNLKEINAQLQDADPREIVTWAHETFGNSLAMTSGFGAESALTINLVTLRVPEIPVIVIDTGYLFPETHAFMEKLRKRFSLNLKTYFPLLSPFAMENQYGKLWKQGKRGLECYNRMRKVEPMERALRELGVKAWISGLRADQTALRSKLKIVERRSDGIYKIHPIIKWTAEEIRQYFFLYDLPYHPLVEKGYSSIGDWHSTLPSKDRSGRFNGIKEECGLHEELCGDNSEV